MVSGGETNWCDYVRFVVAKAIKDGKPMKANTDAIKAIGTADKNTPSKCTPTRGCILGSYARPSA